MSSTNLVSNPIAVKQSVDGALNPAVLSEEAKKALHIRPTPTVWGYETLRPIYNRLPAVEEAYQVGFEQDQARVYIDPKKKRSVGIGTLEVTRDEDNFGILRVQNGTITWRKGSIEVQPITVDTNRLNAGAGLQVGVYQLVYKIVPNNAVDTSPIPGYSETIVKNSLLSDAYLEFSSSDLAFPFYDYYAVSTVHPEDSWRPSLNGDAGSYENGASFNLDFGSSVKTEQLKVVADASLPSTAIGALYSSDNGIKWDLQFQALARNNRWTFEISKTRNQYLKTFFWDGKVSIENFEFTGSAFIEDRRVSEDLSTVVPVVQSLYEAVEGEYIMLATFEVKSVGSVTQLRDRRSVSYNKYQPVASWLTQFQDDNLRCLFDDVTKYDTMYMGPMTSSYHIYEEMGDNICSGLGEINIGEQFGYKRLKLPHTLEADIDSDVSPKAVDLLADPSDESCLTNKAYADFQLYTNWSLDNGIF